MIKLPRYQSTVYLSEGDALGRQMFRVAFSSKMKSAAFDDANPALLRGRASCYALGSRVRLEEKESPLWAILSTSRLAWWSFFRTSNLLSIVPQPDYFDREMRELLTE